MLLTFSASIARAAKPNIKNNPTEISALRVFILTAGLLGEQYLALSPGGDEDFLQDGDEVEDTQSALVIEELIGQFLFSDSSDDI